MTVTHGNDRRHSVSRSSSQSHLDEENDEAPDTEENRRRSRVASGVPNRDRENKVHLECQLEIELYTAAFISPLQLKLNRGAGGRVAGQVFAMCAMIMVAIIQISAILGMLAFVLEQHVVYDARLEFATSMLLKAETPMDSQETEDLCGNFVRVSPGGRDLRKQLTMADGTEYKSTELQPVLQSYKMPTGSWEYQTTSTYMDMLLRINRGGLYNNYDGYWFQGYSTTFVLMCGVHWIFCLVEARNIGRFVLILRHFQKDVETLEGGDVIGTTSFDHEGCMTIEKLNRSSMVVGWTCVFLRCFVCLVLLIVGTYLLQNCTDQLRVVFSAIAMGFVFEFDAVFAHAILNHTEIALMEQMKPIKVRAHYFTQTTWFSIFLLGTVWCGAVAVRLHQIEHFQTHLNTLATLCLFGGSAPGVQSEIFTPVPGFCESVLSATCAPNVTGPGKKHGPCVVSDLSLFHDRTMMFPADEVLFDNENYANGTRRGYLAWGEPKKLLTDSGMWPGGGPLNIFRKICMQMYQPQSTVQTDHIAYDGSHIESTVPFYCRRDLLLNGLFGNAIHEFSNWSANLRLDDKHIAAAIDTCHNDITFEKERADDERAAVGPSSNSGKNAFSKGGGDQRPPLRDDAADRRDESNNRDRNNEEDSAHRRAVHFMHHKKKRFRTSRNLKPSQGP